MTFHLENNFPAANSPGRNPPAGQPPLLSIRQVKDRRAHRQTGQQTDNNAAPLRVELLPGDVLNVMDLGHCGAALMRQLSSGLTDHSGNDFDIRYFGLPKEAWPECELYRFLASLKPCMRLGPDGASTAGLQPGFRWNPGASNMAAARRLAFLSLCKRFDLAIGSPLAHLACTLCMLPETCRLVLIDGVDVFLAGHDRGHALALLTAFADSTCRAIVIASDRQCQATSGDTRIADPIHAASATGTPGLA